ncbi:LacI family DNA-binding transcriptional regulator [Leifsonia sp. NPDC058248]|uniref:LacI family DNA-binding transcriptional regulator n=1 Tax=Leifsonia sp. NPDC058248 TaxID=3346402 RepID=UPI0036D91315
MPTIRDVANAAGVSVGTASRVLAGHAATSEESRASVTAAAAALGYRMNARARSLRGSRTQTLGLLVSDVRNPFFSELAHAAEHAAGEHGYLCLLANANEDADQEQRYLDAFASQQVDGVLMTPQSENNPELGRILDDGTPVVFVDRTLRSHTVPSVTVDNAGGIRSALEHLRRRGHTRVGYIAGPTSVSTGAARLAAIDELRAEFGLDNDPLLVIEGDFRAESGTDAALRMLELADRPTAILAADGLMALGAYAALGPRADPADIELVSFDDLEIFGQLHLPISSVSNDPGTMAGEAVRMLLAAIDGEQVESVVLPTRFIDRSAPRGER